MNWTVTIELDGWVVVKSADLTTDQAQTIMLIMGFDPDFRIVQLTASVSNRRAMQLMRFLRVPQDLRAATNVVVTLNKRI